MHEHERAKCWRHGDMDHGAWRRSLRRSGIVWTGVRCHLICNRRSPVSHRHKWFFNNWWRWTIVNACICLLPYIMYIIIFKWCLLPFSYMCFHSSLNGEWDVAGVGGRGHGGHGLAPRVDPAGTGVFALVGWYIQPGLVSRFSSMAGIMILYMAGQGNGVHDWYNQWRVDGGVTSSAFIYINISISLCISRKANTHGMSMVNVILYVK